MLQKTGEQSIFSIPPDLVYRVLFILKHNINDRREYTQNGPDDFTHSFLPSFAQKNGWSLIKTSPVISVSQL